MQIILNEIFFFAWFLTSFWWFFVFEDKKRLRVFSMLKSKLSLLLRRYGLSYFLNWECLHQNMQNSAKDTSNWIKQAFSLVKPKCKHWRTEIWLVAIDEVTIFFSVVAQSFIHFNLYFEFLCQEFFFFIELNLTAKFCIKNVRSKNLSRLWNPGYESNLIGMMCQVHTKINEVQRR